MTCIYNYLLYIYNFCKYLNYNIVNKNDQVDEELLELEYNIANT